MLSFVSFFFSAEYMEGLTFFFYSLLFPYTPPVHTLLNLLLWKLIWLKSINYNEENPEKKEVLVCIRMLWAYEIFNPSPKARPFVYLFMRISMCNTLSAISLSLFFFFDKRCLSSRSFFFPPRSSSSFHRRSRLGALSRTWAIMAPWSRSFFLSEQRSLTGRIFPRRMMSNRNGQ